MSKEVKYSLELNKFLKYSIWALPILSIFIFVIFFKYSDIDSLKLLFALPFFAFAFWNWAKYFKRPIKINVYQDSASLFNIFHKETKIKFSEINSIESDSSKSLIIRTKSNKIFGVNGFAEFSRFVNDVKSSNQEIIIKGL
jgi:hypothetical protein